MPSPEMDWFNGAMAKALQDGGPGWSGLSYVDYRFPYALASPEELYQRRVALEAAEAARIKESCEAMGLVLCTCTGVDGCAPDGQHVTIRNPRCPVHKQFDRLR